MGTLNGLGDYGMRPGNVSATLWRALQYFNLYRFLIALLFVMLNWMGWLPYLLEGYQPLLFSVMVHIYLILSLVIAFFIRSQIFPYRLQVTVDVLIDIVVISLMMYASSGVSSGFGVLLVISVLGGSILCAGRIAILFAASATLMVLAQEVYADFYEHVAPPNYTHAGFLGLTFFATAFLGRFLATRVRESAVLLERRAADIENLSLLNEYIVQRLQAGLVVLDDSYRIVLLNEAARSLLGISGDYRGRHLEESSPQLFEYLSNWTQKKGVSIVMLPAVSGNAGMRASFTSLYPETGFGVMIMLEDVAQVRQQAQNLKVASLGRLAASIAHEVRNPLGAIGHAGQILSESKVLVDGDRRLVDIIVGHTKRVNGIIENMMHISRRKAAISENIKLDQWMHHFIAEFIAQKNLEEADIRVRPSAKVSVHMDASQLHEVVSNLSENALEYSRGQPLLDYQWGIDKTLGKPYLEVIDHGEGIAPDIVPQLFEPFFTTSANGSGLGLYIARELCEANQASLALNKNTPEGCFFRIHFAWSGVE